MKSKLFQSIKGKIILIGVLSLFACMVIGNMGIYSINKNAKNSDISFKRSGDYELSD